MVKDECLNDSTQENASSTIYKSVVGGRLEGMLGDIYDRPAGLCSFIEWFVVVQERVLDGAIFFATAHMMNTLLQIWDYRQRQSNNPLSVAIADIEAQLEGIFGARADMEPYLWSATMHGPINPDSLEKLEGVNESKAGATWEEGLDDMRKKAPEVVRASQMGGCD